MVVLNSNRILTKFATWSWCNFCVWSNGMINVFIHTVDVVLARPPVCWWSSDSDVDIEKSACLGVNVVGRHDGSASRHTPDSRR